MPRTLLLADTSVTMRKVVEMSFASEDVVVITADNGEEAIARAKGERPDVLLVNVGIPGRDGYEVCEAIKSDPGSCGIPVLLLTGTFEPFDEERAQRVGADGRIMKPFESQVLVDQVNALLERRAPAVKPIEGQRLVTPSSEREPGEDSFDFFDEAIAEPASPSRAAVPMDGIADDDDALEPLEIEPVAADPARTEPEPDPLASPVLPSPPPRPESRVVEPPPVAMDGGETHLFQDSQELEPAPPFSRSPAAGGTTGEDEAFDFDFSAAPLETGTPPDLEAEGDDTPVPGDPLLALRAEELVEEAVLDPEAGRAHEVSSSDLDDPIAPGRVFPAPDAPAGAPPPQEGAAALGGETVTAPTLMGPPEAKRTEAAPPEELSPLLRDRLHETLEKLAWEALGDVPERIVREAVRQIEAIAWEVIPQMAETLIREEIRRLKGGEEDN